MAIAALLKHERLTADAFQVIEMMYFK